MIYLTSLGFYDKKVHLQIISFLTATIQRFSSLDKQQIKDKLIRDKEHNTKSFLQLVTDKLDKLLVFFTLRFNLSEVDSTL